MSSWSAGAADADLTKLPGHDDYVFVRRLGKGNFGKVNLFTEKSTGHELAVKFIERGEGVNRLTEREVINHRSIDHHNVVKFKEVILTPTHLALVMEYVGGELFDVVSSGGRLSEDQARFFFQQTMLGIAHMHSQGLAHRDLKLENIVQDTKGPTPRVCIIDLGYSKSDVLQSRTRSRVGTASYIAPEILGTNAAEGYDGYSADVWSLGVMLHTMLAGAYPFNDPRKPDNDHATMLRIIALWRREACYQPPDYLSVECKDLLQRMLDADPATRIKVPDVLQHPWFLKNAPSDFHVDRATPSPARWPQMSVEEIKRILAQAQKGNPVSIDDMANEDPDDDSDDDME
mmetsp:Transcript_41220/g.131900  ORF Transcript_41220/g.131900 Transcript_41220/m.131900 type:complete len:345 (+) Transcript_41220:167-1201(+)